MINIQHLQRSFKYAFRGLKLAAHENTFRMLGVVAVMAVVAAFVVSLSAWKMVALVLVIMLVLVLEVLNTVFERIADLVEPKMHRYVRELKDLMAAAVLIASCAALIVGIVIFHPYITE